MRLNLDAGDLDKGRVMSGARGGESLKCHETAEDKGKRKVKAGTERPLPPLPMGQI